MSDRALIVLDELDQFIKANKLHTYALSSEWAIDVDELQEKMKEIRTRMAASPIIKNCSNCELKDVDGYEGQCNNCIKLYPTLQDNWKEEKKDGN